MSLLDKLMDASAEDFQRRDTKEYKSRNLKRKLNLQEDAMITLQEVPTRTCLRIINAQYDKNGKFDRVRSREAALRMVTEGVLEPNLKDKALQKHFGAETAADLAELLFGMEVSDISDAILALSGVTQDGEEDAQGEELDEEIKN